MLVKQWEVRIIYASDKTGTLTQNKMTVNKIFNMREVIQVSSVCCKESNRADFYEYFKETSEEWKKLFIESLAVNLEMEIEENDEVRNESKTDLAFLKFLHNFNEYAYPYLSKFQGTGNNNNKNNFNAAQSQSLNLDTNINSNSIQNSTSPNNTKKNQFRRQYTYSTAKELLIKKIPFDSQRKKKSVFIKNSEFPTGYRHYIKGASEAILESANNYLDPETMEECEIDEEANRQYQKIINDFAKDSLRTIFTAYKDINEKEFNNYNEKNHETGSYNLEESGFTVISLFGIRDTLRENVKEAVDQCYGAGIKLIMITGDNINTAIAISKECGIIKNEELLEDDETLISSGLAMDGSEFYNKVGGLECGTCFLELNDCKCPKSLKEAEYRGIEKSVLRKEKVKDMKMFEKLIQNLKILARSRPLDKYSIVLGLKALDNTVAVTGDGSNDAQALSTSDVGFAMGIQGADIAKDAADIIILDDNFSSIVKAVIWGRSIYDNIRKFIQFQLTVNLCACVLVFITAVVSNETPISPIQMLWINLIIDSLGSLALSTQKPDSAILQRKPCKKKEYLINSVMCKHIIIQSITLLIISLILFFSGPSFIPENNYKRVMEGKILKRCFGYAPGESIHPDNTAYNMTNSEGEKILTLSEEDHTNYYILSGLTTEWGYSNEIIRNLGPIECGTYSSDSDLSDANANYMSLYGNTSHFTIVFNVFVLYTLFNQFNARIIDDKINVFSEVFDNNYFIIIICGEFILQILIIEFAGLTFKACSEGLTLIQWLICILLSLITFIVSVFIKLIPFEKLIDYCFKRYKDFKNRNKVFSNENEVNEVEENLRKYTHGLMTTSKFNKIKKSIRNDDSNEISFHMMEHLKAKGLYIDNNAEI